MTVGIVGLGIMGRPMAENLVRGGYEVLGFNRSTAAIDRLVAVGGRAGRSVAHVASEVEVLITMLPDSSDATDVYCGHGGVLENAAEGTLSIDMSTVSPQTSRDLHAKGVERGIMMLDAPVSGGEVGAREGVLSVMVGGDVAGFERAREILDVLGSTIEHVGAAGSGQTVKAANQLIVAGTLQLVSEAIIFLEMQGADTGRAFRVLGGGLAGSSVISKKPSAMLERDFNPRFRMELHQKDLRIALDTARAAGTVLPIGAIVAQLVSAAVARGLGQADHSALLRVAEELSGRGTAT